jgi:hypothetical protein
MERFTKLFATWLLFMYHGFDRMVLSGYLMGRQRPGQVVYWLRTVKGLEAITKQVLAERTPRNDELPAGYSWAGCAPAEPAAAPPAGAHLTRKGFHGTMQFQRPVRSALTVCLTIGVCVTTGASNQKSTTCYGPRVPELPFWGTSLSWPGRVAQPKSGEECDQVRLNPTAFHRVTRIP